MLPRPDPLRQPSEPRPSSENGSTPADASPTPIGVGIDTARYGHYAAFLDPPLQQAAPELRGTLGPAMPPPASR